MPSFQGKFSESDVGKLAALVRSFWGRFVRKNRK